MWTFLPTFDEFQIEDIIKLAPFQKGLSPAHNQRQEVCKEKKQSEAGVTRYITKEGKRDVEG